MAQNMNHSADTCCFAGGDPQNPLCAEHIVVAGDVCGDAAEPPSGTAGCQLARIYFPSQQYRAGYMPGEALKQGTLFPELVFGYAGGGA